MGAWGRRVCLKLQSTCGNTKGPARVRDLVEGAGTHMCVHTHVHVCQRSIGILLDCFPSFVVVVVDF